MRWVVHNVDCLDFLRTLPEGSVDAVVTDPPYGLGKRMRGGSGEWERHWRTEPAWDGAIARGVEQFAHFEYCIIWGGNYYDLPPMRGWMIWDKMQEHSSGHAEMAWTNLDQPIRTFRLSRVQAYSRMGKEHPTQKPIELMKWCLSFLPEGCTVFDPYCGSGTTGVACIQTGRNFIGCEIDAGYAEIARRRCQEAEDSIALIKG